MLVMSKRLEGQMESKRYDDSRLNLIFIGIFMIFFLCEAKK